MKLCGGTLRDEYDEHSGYASDANNEHGLASMGSMMAPIDASNGMNAPPSNGANTLPHNRSIFKSVDTIDRQSGLNHYSLHSIISLATNSCQRKEYELVHRSAVNCNSNSNKTRFSYNLSPLNLFTNSNPSKCNKLNTNKNVYKSFKTNSGTMMTKCKYASITCLPSVHSLSSWDDTFEFDETPYSQYISIQRILRHQMGKAILGQLSRIVKTKNELHDLIVYDNLLHFYLDDFKHYNFDVRWIDRERLRQTKLSDSKKDSNKLCNAIEYRQNIMQNYLLTVPVF